MVTDKRIGVIAGGRSAERPVSLRSGQAVLNALQGKGYDAVFIDADADLCQSLKANNVAVAFLALHGGEGENGSVQGLLEVMGIPYTGSGVLASAVAMDKEASKKVFLYHGLTVAPFVLAERGLSPEELIAQVPFGMPWVVKPVAEGSSIGVNIVKDAAALRPALDEAARYGETILVERFIPGKEIQIGVLEDKALGGVEVRPSKEFYSYEAKYTAGLTDYILPPEVDAPVYEMLRAEAVKAHNALGCKGATRVDFILGNDDGKAYILEVNTIPGMTETSLLPKIAALSGISFPELVEEMLRIALL
ncbi:MAG: D-alanine--D-alanine ligase [Thermodesulfovibrionales bacterium]|jgi:D-alanine-D-alanine ligase